MKYLKSQSFMLFYLKRNPSFYCGQDALYGLSLTISYYKAFLSYSKFQVIAPLTLFLAAFYFVFAWTYGSSFYAA